MNESYVSLFKFHETCCRPMSIQIVWPLLWTSPSKCRDVLLWVNTYPSTILVAEDASALANSTFSHQKFYMFMGINIYPHCIQILCLWNSMLLWANAHANYMFVVVGRSPFELHVLLYVNIHVFLGQYPSNDHICRYGPPPIQISRGILMGYIYPSTILVPEDAMPMQMLCLLLWADSHPNSMCSWGWESIPTASDLCLVPETPCCCRLMHTKRS